MIYDFETRLKHINKLFKDELNKEIVLFNSIKNDSMILEEFSEESFYFAKLDHRTKNERGFFVLHGIVPTSDLVNVDEEITIENMRLFFQVAIFDNGEKTSEDILYRLLRYREVLKNICKKNSDMFQGYAKVRVSSLTPDAYEFYKDVVISAGIEISCHVSD